MNGTDGSNEQKVRRTENFTSVDMDKHENNIKGTKNKRFINCVCFNEAMARC